MHSSMCVCARAHVDMLGVGKKCGVTYNTCTDDGVSGSQKYTMQGDTATPACLNDNGNAFWSDKKRLLMSDVRWVPYTRVHSPIEPTIAWVEGLLFRCILNISLHRPHKLAALDCRVRIISDVHPFEAPGHSPACTSRSVNRGD